MTKLRFNQITDAADPADVEDIDLRRRIAEALLTTDLDLSLIAAGGAAPTLVSHAPCTAWRVRRAKPGPRRRWHLAAISTRNH
jgi:hypothetical protein